MKKPWTARTIGQRVSLVRDELGWDQRELERKAKLARGLVSRIESDERKRVSSPVLYRLSEALGVFMEWLLVGAEPKWKPGREPAAKLSPDEVTGAVTALEGHGQGSLWAQLKSGKYTARQWGNQYRAGPQITAYVEKTYGTELKTAKDWTRIFNDARAAVANVTRANFEVSPTPKPAPAPPKRHHKAGAR